MKLKENSFYWVEDHASGWEKVRFNNIKEGDISKAVVTYPTGFEKTYYVEDIFKYDDPKFEIGDILVVLRSNDVVRVIDFDRDFKYWRFICEYVKNPDSTDTFYEDDLSEKMSDSDFKRYSSALPAGTKIFIKNLHGTWHFAEIAAVYPHDFEVYYENGTAEKFPLFYSYYTTKYPLFIKDDIVHLFSGIEVKIIDVLSYIGGVFQYAATDKGEKDFIIQENDIQRLLEEFTLPPIVKAEIPSFESIESIESDSISLTYGIHNFSHFDEISRDDMLNFVYKSPYYSNLGFSIDLFSKSIDLYFNPHEIFDIPSSTLSIKEMVSSIIKRKRIDIIDSSISTQIEASYKKFESILKSSYSQLAPYLFVGKTLDRAYEMNYELLFIFFLLYFRPLGDYISDIMDFSRYSLNEALGLVIYYSFFTYAKTSFQLFPTFEEMKKWFEDIPSDTKRDILETINIDEIYRIYKKLAPPPHSSKKSQSSSNDKNVFLALGLILIFSLSIK